MEPEIGETNTDILIFGLGENSHQALTSFFKLFCTCHMKPEISEAITYHKIPAGCVKILQLDYHTRPL